MPNELIGCRHNPGPQTPNTGGFDPLLLPQNWGPGGGSAGILRLPNQPLYINASNAAATTR